MGYQLDEIKIVHVNSGIQGSTGNIMLSISDQLNKRSAISYVAYPKARSNSKRENQNDLVIGSVVERNLHILLSYLTGFHGCFSWWGTRKFIKKLDQIEPDIIHLHNLHNSYINIPMLFKYIKLKHISVVWTLHDCWAFTGQCPYFENIGCDKWKTGCEHCEQYKCYPASLIDMTRIMFKLKRRWFTGVNKLTIVTPSRWLSNLVRLSFLGEYPTNVINNGINLDIFRPRDSNFRADNNLRDKFVILGVSFSWGYNKGIDVFIELSKRLDQNYQIVLAGLNQNQVQKLPDSIIGIRSTSNAEQLAEMYSMADLFINPTREDNFPTVNLESLACGTPVITFSTGGSVECIDSTCGCVVEKEDINGLVEAIKKVELQMFPTEACEKKSKEYAMGDKIEEYFSLYTTILKNRPC